MVRPAMEDASIVCDPVTQKHIQLLEKVQRRAARYVFNTLFWSPARLCHADGDGPTVGNPGSNRLYMLYRIANILVDIDQNIYLQASDRRTRGQAWFFQKRTEFHAYRNSFFPRTIRAWNSLPNSVTEATSLEDFRHLLLSVPSTQ